MKTRLAAEIGAEMACSVYRGLAERTLAAVPPDWPVRVMFLGDETVMRDWLAEEVSFFPQAEGDLGEKMSVAVQAAFSEGASSVILLGGDCPGVTAWRLVEAAEKLAMGQDVVGPAVDGGYWTLGLARPFLEVFEGIEWSTERVFPQTMARFLECGRQPALLEELEDVDDLASWTRQLVGESVLANGGSFLRTPV